MLLWMLRRIRDRRGGVPEGAMLYETGSVMLFETGGEMLFED
jgi:hypothetical protein